MCANIHHGILAFGKDKKFEIKSNTLRTDHDVSMKFKKFWNCVLKTMFLKVIIFCGYNI